MSSNNLHKKKIIKNFEDKGYILIKNFYNKLIASRIKTDLKTFLKK